jgi:hypothetical protein
MLSSMGSLPADLTRELFPTRNEHPTLYSARHEAIARWKGKYLWPGQTIEEQIAGLAIVVAWRDTPAMRPRRFTMVDRAGDGIGSAHFRYLVPTI